MKKFKVGDHVIIWAFGRRGIIVKAEGFAPPNYYVHCIETDSGDWYTESELKLANLAGKEKKGEKKQGGKRIKPGDMIVMNELADTKYHYPFTKMGWVGTCFQTEGDDRVVVKDVKSGLIYTVMADAVDPYIRPKRRIVIEITDDGAEAKYIVGKNIEKTASIKRHKDDMPDDRLAAHYVVGKLFGMFGKDIFGSVKTIDVEELKRAAENVGFAFGHIEKVKKILLEQVYGIK